MPRATVVLKAAVAVLAVWGRRRARAAGAVRRKLDMVTVWEVLFKLGQSLYRIARCKPGGSL